MFEFKGHAHVTTKNIKGVFEILDDFHKDIGHFEKNGMRVAFTSAHDENIQIRPEGTGRFPSGRTYWTHNNKTFPILVESPIYEVKLPEDLFTL